MYEGLNCGTQCGMVTPVGKEGQKAFALYLLILFGPPFQSHSSVCCHRIFRPFLQLLAVGFSDGICSCLLGFFNLNFSGMKECKNPPPGTRRLRFSGRICSFWPGFSGRIFSGMGIVKNYIGGRLIGLVSTAGFSVPNQFIY